MKAILTLCIVLFLGVLSVQAQTENTTPTNVTVTTTVTTETVVKKEISVTKENSVARLYRFKNSRVKKALSFRTKRNKSKLA